MWHGKTIGTAWHSMTVPQLDQTLEAHLKADLAGKGQPWLWPSSYNEAPVNPPIDSQAIMSSISYIFIIPLRIASSLL